MLWTMVTIAAGALGILSFDRRRPLDVLTGTVADDTGPVPGAVVRIAGGRGSAVTDADGRFALRRPPGRAILTAAKPGYFISYAEAGNAALPKLRALPRSDHGDYRWVDPEPGAEAFSCGSCHPQIFTEWRGSAHGGRSRFAESFVQMSKDYPEGAAVCASCHDPAPFEPDSRRLSHVHCDFCHKVAGPAGGEIGLTHGKFGLDLRRPAEGQLIFGPLDDSPRRENAYSPFQRDARFCASCHEGTIFGVRVYETFSEWRQSPAGIAGKQCQDCHMKPTGAMTNVAPGHGGLPRHPATLANHRFFAGSQLDMLRRSVKMTLETGREAAAVRVVVDVRAEEVGHRVPTGSPDRSLCLVIEAFDAAGRPVRPIGGPILPEFADHRRRAGRVFAKVLKDWQGAGPVPFWRASPEFADTRLTPEQAERVEAVFPTAAATFQAQLVYRRTWTDAGDTVAVRP